MFINDKRTQIYQNLNKPKQLPLPVIKHLLLAFDNGNSCKDKFTEKLQYLICSPYVLLSYNMLHLPNYGRIIVQQNYLLQFKHKN